MNRKNWLANKPRPREVFQAGKFTMPGFVVDTNLANEINVMGRWRYNVGDIFLIGIVYIHITNRMYHSGVNDYLFSDGNTFIEDDIGQYISSGVWEQL